MLNKNNRSPNKLSGLPWQSSNMEEKKASEMMQTKKHFIMTLNFIGLSE